MKNFLKSEISNKKVFQIIGGILLINIIVYGTGLILENQKNKKQIENFSISISSLEEKLSQYEKDNADLSQNLIEKQNQLDFFSNQVGNITDTVDTLKKISETDPELLKKYSKVYFLNENYVPKKLENINSEYIYNKEKPLLINADILSKLENMLRDAKSTGEEIKVISAFRSFGTQAILKSSYKITYGSNSANKFSADQGYSEHQLGTAVDLTTPKVADTFSGFEKTTAYKWLLENAHKYGFIISYPALNKYYEYEPWHWRFVGVALATYLHDSKKYFYDLDQRTIDSYLGNLFD